MGKEIPSKFRIFVLSRGSNLSLGSILFHFNIFRHRNSGSYKRTHCHNASGKMQKPYNGKQLLNLGLSFALGHIGSSCGVP